MAHRATKSELHDEIAGLLRVALALGPVGLGLETEPADHAEWERARPIRALSMRATREHVAHVAWHLWNLVETVRAEQGKGD